MLYASQFVMFFSTFYDVLNKLQIADTNVEGSKLNRVIDGNSALALHGIKVPRPTTLDLTVYSPSDSQIAVLAKDVPGVVCGITGKELPIVQMAKLDYFKITRKDLTIAITLKRDAIPPEHTLLMRYGASFFRVQGIDGIDAGAVQVYVRHLDNTANTKVPFVFTPHMEVPFVIPEGGYRLGQEFLDEPMPDELSDLETETLTNMFSEPEIDPEG